MNIDWNFIRESFMALASQNPIYIALWLFLRGGWVIFLLVFIKGLYDVWLDARQGQYMKDWKYVVLAINIPKNNEQTPKAVENIFVAIAGAQTSANLIEKYWEGKTQESLSFEIISREGFIQYFIRTPVQFRDLVEAAIYAQYPDAEITEVEDYTLPFKDLRFPNAEIKLWGTEFLLTKDYPFSIRTYPEFEHTLTQTFLDPMAGLLEIMSRMGPSEQAWIQYVVTPLKAPGWDTKAEKTVKKLMGREVAAPANYLDLITKPLESLFGLIFGAAGHAFGIEVLSSEEQKKEEDQWKMFKISPGEKSVLERVERKLSKVAFRVKFRLIYFAQQEVYLKPRGVGGLIGAIQQFNTTDGNGFMPGKKTKTSVDYFRVKSRLAYRQNTILRHFILRKNWYGESSKNMLFSTEELASLWHFPVMTVKAPTVEMIGSKKTAPPARLPYKKRFFAGPRIEPVERVTARLPALQPVEPSMPTLGEPKDGYQTIQPEFQSEFIENQSANPAPDARKNIIAQPIAPPPIRPPEPEKKAELPRKRGAPPPNLPTV